MKRATKPQCLRAAVGRPYKACPLLVGSHFCPHPPAPSPTRREGEPKASTLTTKAPPSIWGRGLEWGFCRRILLGQLRASTLADKPYKSKTERIESPLGIGIEAISGIVVLFGTECVAQRADTFDFQLDDIARLQIAGAARCRARSLRGWNRRKPCRCPSHRPAQYGCLWKRARQSHPN